MKIVIKGAGDLATGVAWELFREGHRIIMTEIAVPLTVRRQVAYSRAVYEGRAEVEGVIGVLAGSAEEAIALSEQGVISVLVDPEARVREIWQPEVVIDAIMAKKNIGTTLTDAPLVLALGPGFTAGKDCHAVIETMRGHTLGRVIRSGEPIPNTNIPGLIGGFAGERVLRAPCDGIFTAVHRIGDTVEEGETIGFVEGQRMKCTISGVLRGVLDDGVPVKKGMKSGDVDPRCKPEYCTTISDKALAVGGGVVEAVLYLSAKAQGRR